MNTDISIESNAPYPPRPEVDLEPVFNGGNSPHPEDEVEPDVSGAASFPVSGKGAGFEVAVEGGSISKSPNRKRLRRPDQQPNSTLLRHVTHCSICNHPEREAIEQSILHWHSPTVIAHEFNLADRRIVYRHAQAFRLFNRRAEQSRHALGFLIEQAQSIVPSADAIIRAVRALACIDDHGHWHEPRKEVVITHRYEEVGSQSDDRRIGAPDTRDQEPAQLVDRSSRRAHRGSRPRRPRARSAAAQPAETQRKSWSPLRLFSTRLLRKAPRNSNRINKTAKTSRHTFGMFDAAEKPAVAPATCPPSSWRVSPAFLKHS